MMNEHETTRGSNGTTRIKEVRRKQWKEKYLDGTYTAVDYRNTILLIIGHENIYIQYLHQHSFQVLTI